MQWIMFDASDRLTPAPSFCLDSTEEKCICLADYHENCNLVLVFAHGTGCESCRNTLHDFAAHLPRFQAEDAQIVAVYPQGEEELAADQELASLPFAVLSDPGNEVRHNYANLMDASLVSQDDSLLFVLDKYNAPYAALVGNELQGETMEEDVLSWLEYIGVQCPE